MKKGRKKRKLWKVRTNDIQAVPWPLHTSVHMHKYTKKKNREAKPSSKLPSNPLPRDPPKVGKDIKTGVCKYSLQHEYCSEVEMPTHS